MKAALRRSMRLANPYLFLAATAILGAVSASGATPDVFAAWNKKLASAIEDLEAGRNEPALRKLESLVEEYVELAGPGSANERNFARLLVHRAIAHQRLGHLEDARWDWDLAMEFHPGAATFDLSRFGDSAPALLEISSWDWLKAHLGLPEEPRKCEGCKFEAPRVTRRVRPRFTSGAAQYMVGGELVVQVLIDPSGRLWAPKVVRKLPAPGLTYMTVQAMRKWKIRPATVEGKPVSVYFTFTVNFQPR